MAPRAKLGADLAGDTNPEDSAARAAAKGARREPAAEAADTESRGADLAEPNHPAKLEHEDAVVHA
jgi:hypothetical protein